jgi:hypothetical protein
MDTNFDLRDIADKQHILIHAITPKDVLPNVLKDGGYIFNMEDDFNSQGVDNMGSHWIALYVCKKGVVYFDSMGFQAPSNIEHFIEKRFDKYIFNSEQIQSLNTGGCGKFSLAFLRFMQTQKHLPLMKRLRAFQSIFSKDPNKNLSILKNRFY